jgi:hypothetical protein
MSYRLWACIWFVLWAALVSFEDIKYESVSLRTLIAGSFFIIVPLSCIESPPIVGAWFSVVAMCVFAFANRVTMAVKKTGNPQSETEEMLGGADIAFAGIAALYTGFWWTAVTIGASVSCLFAFLCKDRRERMCFVPFLAGATTVCLSLRLDSVIPQIGGLI